MNERIVSPGVFTRENDQSYLAKGVGNLGAVMVGPTGKGQAFVPVTITDGFQEFISKFGPENGDSYIPSAAKNYLKSAASVTIVRVLGNGGWKYQPNQIAAIVDVDNGFIQSVLVPSKYENPDSLTLTNSVMNPTNPSGSASFELIISGSGINKRYSASLDPTAKNYLGKVLGTTENNSSLGSNVYEGDVYPYLNFKNTVSGTLKFALNDTLVEFGSEFEEGYQAARTPWITSQKVGNISKNLFRFVTLGHGFDTNKDVKISITSLVEPTDPEAYSTFTVLVRKFADTDKNMSVLEQFTNVNLDPNSPNYISRVIGNSYKVYDSVVNKVLEQEEFPYGNNSNYIRVEVDPTVESRSTSSKLSPRGFRALSQTIGGFVGFNMFPGVYRTQSTMDNNKFFFGWEFENSVNGNNNENYLKALPISSSFDVTGDFSIDDSTILAGSSSYTGSLAEAVNNTDGPFSYQVQFTVPLQGGSDGVNPSLPRNSGFNINGHNAFGFNLSSSTAPGTKAYRKALNILTNSDEYDFNLLVTPGIIREYHPTTVDEAINLCEQRSDAFYIMDLTGPRSTIRTAIGLAKDLDTTYAGVYYPWLRIMDSNLNRPVMVPPSVVMPEVYSFSDRTGAEWFSPAGLTRGGIRSALEANIKLSHSERDALYEGKINPIATFPGSGVVAWGQKTLQNNKSALSSINVRRLLISLRKYISSASNYLVFENNTQVLRNRFLAMVTPYMESIQSKQGLYAFRVVMDESNNTSEVIDRNELRGSIYLQPTRAVEYIILDFNILPTGASFSDNITSTN